MGVDVEMGGGAGLPLFYYFTAVQSHLLWGGGGSNFSDLQSFDLAMQDSHPNLYCTKTWYHLYISDPF